jgi:TRAP-type C4-dicarboxylate transport system substrate-binding protein
MMDLPLGYSLGGVLVNKRIFGKIPSDLQGIVKGVFQHHGTLLNARTRRDNDEAMRIMVKQGIKLVTPTDEEREEFKQISLEATDEIAGKVFSKDVLVEVRSHINQYRKARKRK